MSATPSPQTRGAARLSEFARTYWLELAWVALSIANVVGIILAPSAETVPFHLVWVSLTIVYGIRLWRLGTTWIFLAFVVLGTGVSLAWALHDTDAGWDELTEVPLMAAMFVAVMWHVYRRQTALEEVERLAESEHRLLERQRELVRDASHELRTPITVARGHAELIRRSGQEQVADDAAIVLDELARLSRIAERLLILAVSEHPDFLRREPIDLEQLIVDTARRWGAAAPRRWRVEAPVEGVLEGDEERLKASLDALVENAVKFTGEGDQIAIAGRSDRAMAVIEVSDSGEGIPSDQMERIFERFSRAEDGRPPRTAGTGLGLAMVKAIVEAHGGTVTARSERGAGTTFTLRLPGYREAAAPPG